MSTPTDILAIEACLPPLRLFLAYKRRLASLRILCSPPEINPATARLPPSVQTPFLHSHSPDHRVLSARNAGSSLPLAWVQARPPSKNRAHLPFDALPHSMLFLLGPDGLDPLPVTSQHLLIDHYPEPAPGRSYPQLKLKCKNLLMDEWDKAAPDPARYPFRPSLKPHPFMGLDKFLAGRLHPMRSGKATSAPTPVETTTAPPPALAARVPPRHSSMPSSTAPPRNLEGLATFRGFLTLVPMRLSGPRPPSWAPSPATLSLRLLPSPRVCSHAQPPRLPLFLPAHLM